MAEAKARKKKRAARKLDAARGRAQHVTDNDDLSARSKAKEINKIYSKAKADGAGRGSGKKARTSATQ